MGLCTPICLAGKIQIEGACASTLDTCIYLEHHLALIANITDLKGKAEAFAEKKINEAYAAINELVLAKISNYTIAQSKNFDTSGEYDSTYIPITNGAKNVGILICPKESDSVISAMTMVNFSFKSTFTGDVDFIIEEVSSGIITTKTVSLTASQEVIKTLNIVAKGCIKIYYNPLQVTGYAPSYSINRCQCLENEGQCFTVASIYQNTNEDWVADNSKGSTGYGITATISCGCDYSILPCVITDNNSYLLAVKYYADYLIARYRELTSSSLAPLVQYQNRSDWTSKVYLQESEKYLNLWANKVSLYLRSLKNDTCIICEGDSIAIPN